MKKFRRRIRKTKRSCVFACAFALWYMYIHTEYKGAFMSECAQQCCYIVLLINAFVHNERIHQWLHSMLLLLMPFYSVHSQHHEKRMWSKVWYMLLIMKRLALCDCLYCVFSVRLPRPLVYSYEKLITIVFSRGNMNKLSAPAAAYSITALCL